MLDAFEQHLKEFEARVDEEIARRVQFIRQQVTASGCGGVVVGISGGIDSAVSAALCLRAIGSQRVQGIWLPADSQAVHAEDAEKLAEAISLPLGKIEVGQAFYALVEEVKKVQQLGDLAKGNTKARLRMTALYAVANERGYLVADTCNRSEIYVGYMTKGGDGLADFNPMASLLKHHVRIFARRLGVPESILRKPPSADLWSEQTDEREMGFTYEELDRFILLGEGRSEVVERIQLLHRRSEHKRRPMPEI